MISSYVLVQDNERTIGPILDQLVELSDEIIIVDGGSVDSTPDIVRKYDKVRFYERPFDGNFAGQMNYAIDQARGSWILHMDADELLTPSAAKWIPKLVKLPYVRHFRFPRYWIVEKGGEYFYCVSRIHYPDYQRRLYRNLPAMRYIDDKPTVHSMIPKNVRRYGFKINAVHVYHFHLLKSYEERVKRVKFYEEVTGQKTPTNEAYIWEREGVKLVPLPRPWPKILDV